MSNDKKKRFVRALAVFLVEDQAAKSIRLEMGQPMAMEWANLRMETPLKGYPSVGEAEETLEKFLFGDVIRET